MEPIDGEPVLDLPSRADFDAWLEAQPILTRAVWVRTAKKSSTLDIAKSGGRWQNPWT
ncbi:MAG TPA: hypothetical protein VIR30_06795 [Nocardioides sp.]